GVQRVVPGHDLARDRCVDVADALGGFDLADDVVGRDFGADLGHLGVDDVPECVLGKIGDAHAHDSVSVRGRNPFVFCGVGQLFGNDAHDGPFIGSITNVDGG